MKNTEVFKSLTCLALSAIFSFTGCKGSSNPPSGSASTSTTLSAPFIASQATLDCNTSKTSVIPYYISGIIKFLDKDFDKTGLTGNTTCKPVRFADVQIVRSSDSVVLATGSTDTLGTYSINGKSLLGETVYVRSLTSSATSNKKITVKSGASSALYSVISDDFVFDKTGVVKELTVSVGSLAARPFNVFSVLMDGAIFVETITESGLTKSTTGFYPNGADDGTYFSSPDLFICGDCGGDDDGWDDTVIAHEFGHFIANAYSTDHSQGGNHTLTGHFELPLTWSEGWSTFFSSALRDFLGIADPEYYVDTNGTNSASLGLAYEIETPSKTTDTLGADNEVAVSAVLWDIYDSVNEPAFDDLSLGIGDSKTGIWDVFQNHLTSGVTMVSLEDFWDGWFLRGNGALNAAGDVTGIFQDRSIQYRVDTVEDNDASVFATILVSGTPLSDGKAVNNLTFYPAGDRDWFRFDYVQGTTYTVKTLDSGDRADPMMELYTDLGQAPICTSDDISTSNLNARLTSSDCTIPITGTVYVRLFSSTDPANPAEYGNYNIQLMP